MTLPGNRLFGTALLALVLAVGGCATPHSSKSPHSIEDASPEETAQFKEIQSLFNANKYDALFSKMQAFARKHPESGYLPHIENYYGLSYLALRRAQLALVHFERAAKITSDQPDFKKYLYYNLAKSHYDIGINETNPAEASKHFSDSDRYLSMIPIAEIDRNNQIKCHYLKANLLMRSGRFPEAARETLRASNLLTDLEASELRERRTSFYDVLDASLRGITDLVTLEVLYQESVATPLVDGVLFRLGILEIERGAQQKGRERLQLVISRYPESPYFGQIKEILSRPTTIGGTSGSPDGMPAGTSSTANATSTGANLAEGGAWGVAADVRRVGVLLPMSGRFSRFGSRVLSGIQLGASVLNSAPANSKTPSWELFIEDAGDSTETALQALDRLVHEHQVGAIIGPISTKGLDQIAAHGRQLGIPLINLSKMPTKQDHVLSMGPVHESQIREIARYAILKRGWKRIAILYPNDRNGQSNAHLFWDAAQEFGAEIRAFEGYDPAETDFRRVVDQVVGLSYPDARSRELEQLAQERRAQQIKKRTRKTEKFFSLPPVIDFDAVFIADEPRPVSQIIPTFSYRDVDNVHFLGTASWNSPDLVSRTSTGLDRIVLTDLFSPESESPQSQEFLKSFKSEFSSDPTFLEAIGWDSIRFYLSSVQEQALQENKLLPRQEILRLLKTDRQLDGATGKLTISPARIERQHQFFAFDKAGKLTTLPQ